MFKKLFSIFSGDENSSSSSTAAASGTTAVSTAVQGEADLDEFVRFVVTSLVDDPDKVTINRDESGEEIKIVIDCDKKDIGRIIGRKGRNIDSIRSLVRGAARRSNQKVTVEITDK